MKMADQEKEKICDGITLWKRVEVEKVEPWWKDGSEMSGGLEVDAWEFH